MAINPATMFSILGNPNSLVPLAIKDLSATAGMTAGSFVTGKEEGVDRFIDEIGTEIIWLFGIPFFKKVYDGAVFNTLKLDGKFDPRNLKDKDIFEKTKEFAPTDKIKKSIEKIGKKQTLFKNASALRFAVSTIATVLTYFGLTRFKQKYTEKKIRENLIAEYQKKDSRDEQTKSNISFKGLDSVIEKFAFSPVRNMWILDGSITAERLINSRSPQEFVGYTIKEASTLCFMYYAGGKIQELLEKNSEKKYNKSISLDAMVLEENGLKSAFENGSIKESLVEFAKLKGKDVDLYEFLHKNPENLVVKTAKQSNIIKMYKNSDKIDTRRFIDLEKVKDLGKKIEELYNQYQSALKNGETSEQFFASLRKLKRKSILLNIGTCILALGVLTPALMLAKRKAGKDDIEFETKKRIREQLINEGIIA